MCDPSCVNLIDLSLEEKITVNTTQTKNKCGSPQGENDLSFIASTCHKREILDNNPFDQVEKLSDYLTDPFNILEKEACLMAQQFNKPAIEVKLGDLLSLSDDNLLDDKKMIGTPPLVAEEMRKVDEKEIEYESPPVLFNEKQPPDSVSGPDTDSNPNSSTEISTSAKLKKNMEHRKRLLKFSISNASVSSPISGKQSLDLEKMLGTPVSSTLSKDAEFEEHLLAAESPLKLVEDEDLISENIPVLIDSEKNFEADLEMLKIPILSELPSPAVEQTSSRSTETSVETEDLTSVTLENTLSNIDAIKAKLKAKKEEINNNQQQEILTLIHSLKYLISRGEMADKNKTQKASELLESLSSTLKSVNKEESVKPLTMLSAAPQNIKRQGTFNMELQEEKDSKCDDPPLVEEMPNCMVSSSATYDGEPTDEKHHLNLPEITSVTPQSPPHPFNYQNSNSDNEHHLQTDDVNDIMEQLSKLIINNSANNPLNNNNPTFIVVMNANQFNHSNLHNSNKNDNLENSINDDSPDLTKIKPRRRSQSLSIHDKVKIIQLPLQQLTPRPLQKQQGEHLNKSPPITTPASDQNETTDFKTPSRIVRCNSYSSGSPYTSQLMVRRSGFGYESKNSSQMRRTKTLDTHHEGQHQAIVRPLSMPSNNLATFKPDLKKKSRHVSESIIKSSAPLKATIPMKKVAPMVKTCPPTPEKKLHNLSLQSQSKISKLPSTPLQLKKKSTLGVGVDYPNACSTPAALTSPLKRSTGVSKPRHSYMSTTPNSKSSVAKSATSASMKRRTIAEFKAKSPLKARVSGAGLMTSTTATGSSRLSTSAGARISKTPVKTVTASKASVKPTSRLSYRVSAGGSVSTGNKENKRP